MATSERSLQAALVHPRFIRRVVVGLFVLVALLLAAYLVFNVLAPNTPRSIRDQVHLDKEGNWATWFNGTLNLLAGMAALLVAWLMRGRTARRGPVVGWLLLAAIFIYLSMDDAAALHETLAGSLINWLGNVSIPGLEGLAQLRFHAWIIVLGVPGVIVLLVALKFFYDHFWHIPRVRWLVVAGFLLLASNVATELLESRLLGAAGYQVMPGYEVLYQQNRDTWLQLSLLVLVQEATEMSAVILFMAGFLYAGEHLVRGGAEAVETRLRPESAPEGSTVSSA